MINNINKETNVKWGFDIILPQWHILVHKSISLDNAGQTKGIDIRIIC